jgi:riboflavin biosynthesis pyrimidine reductase
MGRMPRAALVPLKTLIDSKHGNALALPPRLARLYGDLRLPAAHPKPFIFSNFVTTLDGVVSLRTRGHCNGSDISGFDAQDRMVMGLLRAVAGAVVVGAGSLAADPRHVWTPEAICPELAPQYARLRRVLGLPGPPLNVIVSGSGSLNLRLPVFSSGRVRVLLLTSSAGAQRLRRQRVPSAAEIRAIHRSASIPAGAICREISRISRAARVLVEGGPTLLADFFAQRLIAEQFLTLAPQIAGRDSPNDRPGLVMGRVFAPRHPVWGTLLDARQGASHLFLRYRFGQPPTGER